MKKIVDNNVFISLIITLGIVYGDIGTSPLYVVRAIVSEKNINDILIFGGVSCIFWTITLQTTLKYIILVLNADRKGQGGMLSLYSLVKKRKRWWIIIFAIIGASMLLAESIITPAISVSSAVEGLKIIYPDVKTVPIIIAILLSLFFIQRFGTNFIGIIFGPLMLIWFSMIGVLGLCSILNNPQILKAINPLHAINLLTLYPNGFWIIGAVFLCTTGAEALYSDLGHCKKKYIRIGWIFVKLCLLLNYFGQGSWLFEYKGQILSKEVIPFYSIVPSWFLIPSIIIATLAAIIASQALISGAFSLINEASRLNLCPKFKTKYPASNIGQIYIPIINLFLCIGCLAIVLIFKESAKMEAIYGLSVVTTMINTTILFFFYLGSKKIAFFYRVLFLLLFLFIEVSFLIPNITKLLHGGWIVFLIAILFIFIMLVYAQVKIFKRKHTKYTDLEEVIPLLIDLSNDERIPKLSTHLAYMTSSDTIAQIENKIVYSIFDRSPKRADIYWFIHVKIVDEPDICEYKVNIIAPKDIIRIDFRFGFKVEPKISLFFYKVVEELVNNKEINIVSDYEYKKRQNIFGDANFVILKKYISSKNNLSFYEKAITKLYAIINQLSVSENEKFGIDDEPNSVILEKVPMIFREKTKKVNLKRIY